MQGLVENFKQKVFKLLSQFGELGSHYVVMSQTHSELFCLGQQWKIRWADLV
jgi:hypothetical protein